ncbi:MAG: hypothetical protein HON98_00045 [Chloroflexi bacterium]|jgi:hypothetical protein|nr:hypothetical protein [Chloroflexota bacterium]MBT3670011.1 hypothetical protein [Chloroflexota bacterium]MBT4003718.1 hypothetical protein [Chloroflexota bacterium]MBT4304439.1 hypothetical protein [Chloroflexota bacterium]MBT4534907.1 hypothetical protein [Chloroflexota bacterium]
MKIKKNTFDIILLIARPAAGKSEIIDYLKRTPIHERKELFHIGEFEEIDDFPMLWSWFEEDQILEEMGHSRLHTDQDQYFIGHQMWDLLIKKICLEYDKKIRDISHYHETNTAVIEFARGKQHGGFTRAFEHLSKSVIEKAAILYVDVSWEESLRKNEARFNPDRPDSILEHGLSKKKMEVLYRENDWQEIVGENSEFIEIMGTKVPFAVFSNEDDVTTVRGEALGKRLEEVFSNLWGKYKKYR